jgi:hypothetical protein
LFWSLEEERKQLESYLEEIWQGNIAPSLCRFALSSSLSVSKKALPGGIVMMSNAKGIHDRENIGSRESCLRQKNLAEGICPGGSRRNVKTGILALVEDARFLIVNASVIFEPWIPLVELRGTCLLKTWW